MSDREINLPVGVVYVDPMKNSTDILDKRKKKEQKKVIIATQKIIEQFDYRFAQIKNLVKPEKYGLNENYFGGNCSALAELKNSQYVLCVNDEHQTIGILIPNEIIPTLSVSELKKLCSYKNLKIEKDSTKEELIDLLTK